MSVELQGDIVNMEMKEFTELKGGAGMHRITDRPIEEIMKEVEELLRKRVATAEGQSSKDIILAVLARAADDPVFFRSMFSDPHEALKEYYTLSAEEKAALASGDIKKIEAWVGKLDERLATWLWCRLSQEQW